MNEVVFIGHVHSSLKDIKDCPLQEAEGAPEAEIIVEEKFIPAIAGLQKGDKIVLMTWLHKSDRRILSTKPRNNPRAVTRGVFATRSPDRPNPIGLHESEILEITNGKITIANLEVLDGTPVIDIKISLNR